MSKKVVGVGINDADYPIYSDKTRCPYYRIWATMLKRCYSKKHLKLFSTYRECMVAQEWLSFMSFRQWMMSQDWEGKELDKDIMFPGNKLYSPSTCVFVDHSINTAINMAGKNRSVPHGVEVIGKKYRVQISKKCKRHHIGMYEDKYEAGKVYLNEKIKYFNELAGMQSDIRIKDGLKRHAELVKLKINDLCIEEMMHG